MTFVDTIQLALRNLRQATLRTSLTTMGVSIGIASLAGMVSLGVGLQDQLLGQFTQGGMFDTITVSPRGVSPLGAPGRGGDGGPGPAARSGRGFRRGGPGMFGNIAPTGKPEIALDDDAIRTLIAIPGVREVDPSVSVTVDVTRGGFSEPMTLAGVPLSSRDDTAYRTPMAGAFFTNDEDDACLLTLDAAKEIDATQPTSLVGAALTLSYMAAPGASTGTRIESTEPGPESLQLRRVTTSCRVSGIIERDAGNPMTGGRGGASIVMPLGRVKAIRAESVNSVQALLRAAQVPTGYASLTVKVKQIQATQDVESRIKALGFSAFSLNDGLQGAKRAFIVLDIMLSLIGSIALAVSSLGIANTMVMSILERTREIGIMKAIGASDGDIRRIFLIEASTIGAMGGLAGVALGWLVGRAINLGANLYIESQGGSATALFSMPWWLISGSIGFSVVVSIMAGSYPANRAARLDPMKALRHD